MGKYSTLCLLALTLAFSVALLGTAKQPTGLMDTYTITTEHRAESPVIPEKPPVSLVAINTATAEQLDELPHIGAVLAERIIAYRAEYGYFTQPTDLLAVDGIGEKTLIELIERIDWSVPSDT